jgi:hypothetical protein
MMYNIVVPAMAPGLERFVFCSRYIERQKRISSFKLLDVGEVKVKELTISTKKSSQRVLTLDFVVCENNVELDDKVLHCDKRS